MGTFHNQDQAVVGMETFTPPRRYRDDIRKKIVTAARNKATGVDGTHNELIKLSPDLFSDLLLT